ncbi:hypothetical protein B0H15DRAFT_825010 [Mycena belliarum]|uniref:Uncharacterized protein n=1 Tax=Mycena belliarum TaxID=1033014 RepID=A0AAD6UD92_9AGAR|nr:hypothetical protein B0H15DRAFT_825010 [Mycena belliae]
MGGKARRGLVAGPEHGGRAASAAVISGIGSCAWRRLAPWSKEEHTTIVMFAVLSQPCTISPWASSPTSPADSGPVPEGVLCLPYKQTNERTVAPRVGPCTTVAVLLPTLMSHFNRHSPLLPVRFPFAFFVALELRRDTDAYVMLGTPSTWTG